MSTELISFLNEIKKLLETYTKAPNRVSKLETHKRKLELARVVRGKFNTKFGELKHSVTNQTIKDEFDNIYINLIEKIQIQIEHIEQPEIEILPEMDAQAFLTFASRIVPDFDGTIENRQRFIDALNLLMTQVGQNEALAVALVKTKLTGTARSLITNENTLIAIRDTLLTRVRGESSEVLLSKLVSIKQNNRPAVNFVKDIEDITRKLESAYISDGMTGELAQKYASQNAIKVLSTNVSNDQIKLVMQAGNFNSVNEAVAKFLNTSNETANTHSTYYAHKKRNNFNPNHFKRNHYNNRYQQNQKYNNFNNNRHNNQNYRNNNAQNNNQINGPNRFNNRNRQARPIGSGNATDPQSQTLGDH